MMPSSYRRSRPVDRPWPGLVRTSGPVLQGLSFQPSGAIVAGRDNLAAVMLIVAEHDSQAAPEGGPARGLTSC
jgi:hypothetical protein